MKFNFQFYILVGLCICLLTGCATLTKPQVAEIKLNSKPENVQVLLNGRDKGVTPLTLSLDRKSHHNVTFMIHGIRPVHVQIKPKLDFATTVLGNLVSWNLIGVVVDLVTGHAYSLSPSDIEQNFESISSTVKIESSENEITFLLFTKAEWEQISSTGKLVAVN